MDIKKSASVWQNVQTELSDALTAFASDLGRVFSGAAVGWIDEEKAAQDSPVIARMHEFFEYGILGRWDQNWESIDPDDEDTIFFVEDLRLFRLANENSGNADMPLSRYVVGCAIARLVHDQGVRLVFPPGEPPFTGYCASDLAYLSGLDERTVRNLMGKKGVLRSVSIDSRAFVKYDDGAAWLASRGFKETEFIGEEARDVERYPFTGHDDLAKHISALMMSLKMSDADAPRDVQELLAAARAGTFKFELRQAMNAARQLNVEPKPFTLALARFVADEQRRAIERAFANDQVKQ